VTKMILFISIFIIFIYSYTHMQLHEDDTYIHIAL